jgi:uncharacterized protein with FMN-binding domain
VTGGRRIGRPGGALGCLAGVLAVGIGGCGQGTPATVVSTATAPPPSPPAGAAGGAGRTVNGAVVGTRFGDIQVAVTISKGRITDVEPVVLPTDRPRSAEISRQAAPLLRQESLQAQSGKIDILSGATYTSEAWAQSLSAALAAR